MVYIVIGGQECWIWTISWCDCVAAKSAKTSFC